MAEYTMTKDTAWELPIEVGSNGTIKKVIKTQDTFVDKNINVTVTTPDAVFEVKDEGEISATVSTSDTIYTSDTKTDYPIVIKADAEVTDVTVGVKTAGFAADTDTITVSGDSAETDEKTIYVKAGSLTGSGTVDVTSDGKVDLGSKLTSAPTTGYYIKAAADGSVGVGTSGWVDTTKTEAVETDAIAYYSVASASINNSATTGQTYSEKNAPVLVSGEGLYINEGYIENTYIPLATLVPDEANVKAGTDGNSHLIYETVSVYDKDGNLVAGTMGDAVLSDITASSVSANVNTLTVTAKADESAFTVTGSGDISGTSDVAIETAGYATTALSKSGSITGTASVNSTLAKIGLAIDKEGTADGTVKPVISKNDATTASTGAITTTAPEDGYYIAVNTSEVKEDITLKPVVTTEGYGTADVYSETSTTVTATAEASGTYYVPINAGGHTITTNESQVVNAVATVSTKVASSTDTIDISSGILTTAPSGVPYISINTETLTTDGSVQTSSTCDVSEGYVNAESKTTTIKEDVEIDKTEAAAKYIKIFTGLVLDGE